MLRTLALGVAATIIFAARVAYAAGPSEADVEAAKVHYQAGAQYYERGAWDDAIHEFQEAYKLSKAPALLYNMSQAYEKKGDIPAARDALKKYIDSGELEEGELPQLQDKLRAYDQQLKEKREAPKPPPKTEPPPPVKPAPPPPVTTTAPEPATTAATTATDTGARRPFKTWKWVAGGAAVVSAAASIAFVLDANSQSKTLRDAAGANPPRPYDSSLQDVYSHGQRSTTLAVVFATTGVAFAATSIIMFVVDGGQATAERAPAATIVPFATPSSAGAAATFRF